MKKETKENVSIIILMVALFVTALFYILDKNTVEYKMVMSAYGRGYYEGSCNVLETILSTERPFRIDMATDFKRDSAEYSELLKQVYKPVKP